MTDTLRVLVVDDNPTNINLLTEVLEPLGHQILAAAGGEAALRLAAKARPDLILLDVMMPGMDGFATCGALKQNPATGDIPVLFISARDDLESLECGFAAGGVDYIVKPFQSAEVVARVQTHLQLSRVTRELQRNIQELEQRSAELQAANDKLRAEMAKRQQAEAALEVADAKLASVSEQEVQRWGLGGFVGQSRTLKRILQEVRRLQNFSTVNVLIQGESGTGKELVARALHHGSHRAKGPFVAVNCVAIPEDLAESMLFGHLKGAFTGATMDRKGYFEQAHGGTLFLDEIGDMPLSIQAKLLRVLEDSRLTPVGAAADKRVDVRVLAATNVNLEQAIAQGKFRQDLYFRLAQFNVDVPPLRERRDDIPLLATHFVRLFAEEMGLRPPALSAGVVELLTGYEYPGNIRELKNIMERAVIQSGGADIRECHVHLPRNMRVAAPEPTGTLPLNLDEAEELLIQKALAASDGNISEAARRLGINRTRIYRRMNEKASG